MSVNPRPIRGALAYPDFRRYQLARFFLSVALQMQSVAVGWHVYAVTGRALDLGLVGLVQFLPSLVFALLTGHAADRFDRRKLLFACYVCVAFCCSALLLLSRLPAIPMPAFYATLFVLGTARAFAAPAAQSLVTHLVPTEHFANAVSWSSITFEAAIVLGPTLGGLIYGWTHSPSTVYAACLGCAAVGATALARMEVRTGRMEQQETSWSHLVAGVKYVFQRKIILGTISLDLFAVLLGGAVALLPIYAKDILAVGPSGLGILKTGQAVGAASMALYLAYHPLKKNAGALMLCCVGLFGVATIVFGLSKSFTLSLFALAVLGASDMVSVVIRLTLVQLATPPQMRGRVSAVNMVFVGASNELGEFESGVTAAWLGPVGAVVAGGVGTLLVVLLWARLFPELRRIHRIEDVAVDPAESAARPKSFP